MNKTIFITGIFFGVLAIILGAFGAHGLEKLLDAKALSTFETGVKYQMYHALFLLLLSGMKWLPDKTRKWTYFLVSIGVIFFSFSIYLLATNELTGFDFKTIAMIIPIGGICLIAGWVLLGLGCLKRFN